MKLFSVISKSLRRLACGCTAALCLAAPAAWGQASYTGLPYIQSFDALANTGSATAFTDNVTPLPGWYAENYDTGYGGNGAFGAELLFAGTRQAQSDNYTPGTGSSNAGAVYSFGVAGVNAVTDRALGYVGSGTPDDVFIGVAVKNDSGAPLAGFTVTYDGEQWRIAGSQAAVGGVVPPQRPETVVAFYRVGGTAFDASTPWTPISSLAFTSPNISNPPDVPSSGGALDGNAPANRVAGITATINVPVQMGEVVWILWADADHGGNDHGMAIDNFVFNGLSATVGAPVISSSTTATGEANQFFTYTITASESPTSYGASGLPVWLSIDTATGVLSGTPTAPGTFPVTITATNGSGTGSAVLNITVAADPLAPVITSGQEIVHLINTPLSYQLLASNTPVSYTCGTLPAGLSFDSVTGIISGTPTTAVTFTNVAVSATNARGTGTGVITVRLVSAPVFSGDTSVAFYAGAQGVSYALNFSTTPAPFAYGFDGLAATGLVNNSGSTISGTVTSTPGTYPITVTAANDYGSTEITFNVIILDQAAQNAIPQNVVINKFSNSEPDRVELLVVGNGSPGSTVDMRGMILKDFSGDIGADGGGRAVFASNSLWSAVPAGTLIVLSAGNTASEDLIGSDFVLAVNLGNTTYFSTLNTFDIATREMVMIKAAGTGTGGVAGGIHALASGTSAAAQYVAFTGPKLRATGETSFPTGVFAINATSSLADFNGTEATGAVPVASLIFGSGNNATNQAYIDSLRLTGTPATPLEEWLVEYFGTSEDTAELLIGATEDFDGDGLSNLLEYAFNTDPTEAGASPVATVRDGNFLELTYPRITDSALTYTVLGSSDLTVPFGATSGTTETVAGVSTYTDNVDLSAPGVRRFLRVEVTYTE